MTSPKKEVLKTKVCCYCGIEKPIKNYYVNNNLPSGFMPRCKVCFNNGNRCRKRKGTAKIMKRDGMAPKLWNVRKSDWVDTFMFLKKIGYELSGDKTIHEQFCERHNLEPRGRMKEKSIQYSPKDLGLV